MHHFSCWQRRRISVVQSELVSVGIDNLESGSNKVEETFLRRWQSFEGLQSCHFDFAALRLSFDFFFLRFFRSEQQREEIDVVFRLIVVVLPNLSVEFQRPTAVIIRGTAASLLRNLRYAASDQRGAFLDDTFPEAFDAVAHFARPLLVRRQFLALLIISSAVKASCKGGRGDTKRETN